MSLKKSDYTEKHHILPKSLFPQYSDLKIYKWNKINLTAKQHIVAHIILWKAFGKTQAQALECMLQQFNSNTNDYLSNRKIPSKMILNWLSKIREDANLNRSNFQKGKSTYIDKNGNKYFLKNDDPMITELNLVGNNFGKTQSEISKEKMSKAKFFNRKVKMYFLDCEVKVKLFSDNFDEYLNQGWNLFKTDDDKKYIKEKTNRLFSEKYKGRGYYYNQDGSFYGRILHDDPIISELKLIKKKSEKQKEQQKNGLIGSIHNKGKKAYNNGIIEKNFIEGQQPIGWMKGGLKRKPYSYAA